MDEDAVLSLWMNSLGMESTSAVDTLSDVTNSTLSDIVQYLLGDKDGNQEQSREGNLLVNLRKLELSIGVDLSRFIERLRDEDEQFNPQTKRELLKLLRQIHRAETVRHQTEALASANKRSPATPRPVQDIADSPPPPPPPARPRPAELANRVAKIITLGDFFAAKLENLAQFTLADGVLLCGLVLGFEKRMGMPPRRDAVLRRVNYENLLFFAGVEVNPRSRAAKLKNVEAALSALRQWKRFTPRNLWSGPNIVDCQGNEAMELVEQMIVFVERFVSKEASGRSRSNSATSELAVRKVEDDLACPQKEDWSYIGNADEGNMRLSHPRSPLPSPPPPPPGRPSLVHTSFVVTSPPPPRPCGHSSVVRESSPGASPPPPPSASPPAHVRVHAIGPKTPPRSSLPQAQTTSLSVRKSSLTSVGFLSLQSAPPPPPPPPPPPMSPTTPPPPPPPPLHTDHDDECNGSYAGEYQGISQLVPLSRPSFDRSKSVTDGRRSSGSAPTVDTSTLPQLLEPRAVRVTFDKTSRAALLDLFQGPRPLSLSPEEKHSSRMWLFKLGFNLLRTNVFPCRMLPPDRAATKEFAGYEGGPFLSDPIRNGKVLLELAGMLERSLSGVSILPATMVRDSFPDAKERVGHSLQRLDDLAAMYGFAPGIFGNAAQEQILSGSSEAWTVFYALSLAFHVEMDCDEQDKWDMLFTLGVVEGREEPTTDDWEKISNGEIIKRLMNLGRMQENGLSSQARTRKTAIASIEKSLRLLNIMLDQDMSLSLAARRIHDGDVRLFFRCLDEVNWQEAVLLKEGQTRSRKQQLAITRPIQPARTLFLPSSSMNGRDMLRIIPRRQSQGLDMIPARGEPSFSVQTRSLPKSRQSTKLPNESTVRTVLAQKQEQSLVTRFKSASTIKQQTGSSGAGDRASLWSPKFMLAPDENNRVAVSQTRRHQWFTPAT